MREHGQQRLRAIEFEECTDTAQGHCGCSQIAGRVAWLGFSLQETEYRMENAAEKETPPAVVVQFRFPQGWRSSDSGAMMFA